MTGSRDHVIAEAKRLQTCLTVLGLRALFTVHRPGKRSDDKSEDRLRGVSPWMGHRKRRRSFLQWLGELGTKVTLEFFWWIWRNLTAVKQMTTQGGLDPLGKSQTGQHKAHLLSRCVRAEVLFC